MSNEPLVFEVSESGFSKYVLENSHKLPVLVEFMGVWSEPCVVMSDAIHDLAVEFAGQFVFAKVDIDEQPGLKEQFNVENIPTLMVFQKGEATFSQPGQMQQDEVRTLLKGLNVFNQSDALREQARAKHMAGETPEAIVLLTQAIQQEPGNTRVAMDMVQIFIDIGELEQAKGLFNKLPNQDKETDMGKSLIGQLTFADLAAKTDGVEALSKRIEANPSDHAARFDIAICYVTSHDYESAIDQLFAILKIDPEYKEGAAKEMIITISNMLAANDPDQAQNYRRRLANMTSH